jgi:hypothetical protein
LNCFNKKRFPHNEPTSIPSDHLDIGGFFTCSADAQFGYARCVDADFFK